MLPRGANANGIAQRTDSLQPILDILCSNNKAETLKIAFQAVSPRELFYGVYDFKKFTITDERSGIKYSTAQQWAAQINRDTGRAYNVSARSKILVKDKPIAKIQKELGYDKQKFKALQVMCSNS